MAEKREQLIVKEDMINNPSDKFIDKPIIKKIRDIWSDNTYIFDAPAFILVLFGAVYLTFISTNLSFSETSQDLAKASTIASTLLLYGMVFYVFLYLYFKKEQIKPKFEEKITTENTQITIIFVAVFFSIEYIIQNALKFLTLSSIAVDQYLFYVAMAIAETVIFVVMFQITFEALTKQPIIGVLAHATFFLIYHMNVYGGSNTELIAVFLSGLNFAIAAKMTKRMSVVMIIHIISNLLALGIFNML